MPSPEVSKFKKRNSRKKKRRDKGGPGLQLRSFFSRFPWNAFLSVNGINRPFFPDPLG